MSLICQGAHNGGPSSEGCLNYTDISVNVCLCGHSIIRHTLATAPAESSNQAEELTNRLEKMVVTTIDKTMKTYMNKSKQISIMTELECQKLVEIKQNLPIVEYSLSDGRAFLSNKDQAFILKKCTNEHVLIVRMTPFIQALASKCKVVYFNSEEYKWIHTLLEHKENFQKPDGSCTLPGLFIPIVPKSDSYTTLRASLKCSYLFGKGIWNIRDMYASVWEFKTNISNEDRGKAYSYLLHLSREDEHNTYMAVLASRTEFYVMKCKFEVIIAAHHCLWTTKGSYELLKEAMTHRNRWSYLVVGICERLDVVTTGYLGKGKYGRCFRVKQGDVEYALKVVNLSLASENPSIIEIATKSEYFTLLELIDYNFVVEVKVESLVVVSAADGRTEGLGYLMMTIGEEKDADFWKQSDNLKMLFQSLLSIHRLGRYHGDCRISNVLWHVDRPRWIDFMRGSAYDPNHWKWKNDFLKLVASLLDVHDNELDNKFLECVEAYENAFIAGNFEALDRFVLDLAALVIK